MGSAAHYGGIKIDIQIQKEFKLMVENHDIEKMCIHTTIHGNNSVRTDTPNDERIRAPGRGVVDDNHASASQGTEHRWQLESVEPGINVCAPGAHRWARLRRRRK
jgi:hypothetical protein